MRLSVQLVLVADGYHLWSERFDREVVDVFAVKDEIAAAIAAKLQAPGNSALVESTMRCTAPMAVDAIRRSCASLVGSTSRVCQSVTTRAASRLVVRCCAGATPASESWARGAPCAA